MTTHSIDRLFPSAMRSSEKRRAKRSDRAWRTACAVFLFCAATALLLPAQTLTTLANFSITSNPYGVLVRGSDGNYYGTTYGDGTNTGGIVYQVTPTGTFTTLHSFTFCAQTPCSDGQSPTGGLIQASDGALYGTTTFGGTGNHGTIFKITTTGTLTTLYSFCATDCTDGAAPYGALVQDSDGNFYGTTNLGGVDGDGTVFEFTLPSTLTTLYSFCSAGTACPDGAQPQAGLVQGKDGNFYGTTYAGGNANCASGSTCGTIFKITPSGTLTTLYSFCPQTGCADGEQPHDGVIQGTDGNFYGTTYGGGSGSGGTIFRITPTGTLTTLYSFCSQTVCADGQNPWGALLQGSDGNYYGTTALGGANLEGTIFEMSATGTWTKLWDFCQQANCTDGAQPYSAMVEDPNGIFYGTGTDGGTGFGGTVFSYSQIPVTNASPSSLSFGNQTVGTSSGQQATTLTNIGGATLSISSITVMGTNSGEFAQTDNCPSSLAPGNKCSISVTFTPTATGSASAAISISDNAAGSPQSVSLTGTGVGAVPVLGIFPTSLNFGNQTVGTTSGQQSTTLSNTGSANLTITSINITGTNSSEFALATSSCSSSLTPGNSCNISVTFSPAASGSASAAISISDNATGSPQSVSLTGKGVAGISFSPATVNFASQYVGSSGPAQTVTLTNTGDTVVTIKSVTASAADFTAQNGCGSSLAAGASCSIQASFHPTTSGASSGLLTVSDNLSGSPQTVSLTGIGEDFSLVSSSSTTATVTPGQTATYTLVVSPGGGFDDTVTLGCSGAPDTSTCSVSPATVTLNGASSVSVTVTATTAGTSANVAHPMDFPPASSRLALWLALSGLPGLIVIGRGSGNRRGKRQGRLFYGLAVFCVLLVILWSACGGGSSSASSSGNGSSGGGTVAGTYNLTVTGTCTTSSVTLTHNAKLTLVVQ